MFVGSHTRKSELPVPEFKEFLGRDYVAEVAGARVGWILFVQRRADQEQWMWVLTGFGYGAQRLDIRGECSSFEAAKSAFHASFNNWLSRLDGLNRVNRTGGE
jgi:hypothetical protein